MYLTTVSAIISEIDNPSLSVGERALLRCRLARQQEQAGDYKAASEALAELWPGVGARPNLEGLTDHAKAEVLLRVGAITGWLGSIDQIEGSQEAAKDLMSEALGFFQVRGIKGKAAEAESDLALCYWRAGAFDEARIMLQEALRGIDERNVEMKAAALLRAAEVERSSKRLSEALRIYNEAIPTFARVDDVLLIAHFHHGFANVLNQLSAIENNRDYIDRALMEYTAASIHFEQAGHERYQACVENNVGFLFSSIGRFDEAHEHLDRAQVLLTKLGDKLRLAQADETRARVLLAEGKIVEAEKVVRRAVRTLESGDEIQWLVEALVTHGIALARLDHSDQARVVLDRAIETAEQAGDPDAAGLAALTIIEQVGAHLSTSELCEIVDHARSLLEKTDDIGTLRRLCKAAFRGLFLAQAVSAPPDWENFSLREAVRKLQANLIRKALRESKGSVTDAARLLGFKHHQSLISLLQTRHSELSGERKPARKRRKHLINHPKQKQKKN